MYQRFISLFVLTFAFCIGSIYAQYEGEIRFEVYNPDLKSKDTVQMNMTFTKNRIFIDSDVSLQMMAGLRTHGVLVRHDMQDFVMLTGRDEALKVAKNDLESLTSMMNRMQGNDGSSTESFSWEERVVETGEQRNILGYTTYQFILKGDKEGDYASVWLTDEITVDWGLLQDAWYTFGSKQFKQEIPVEMVMNNRSFPLLVEAYENNEMIFQAKSVSVSNDNFDRSKTQLSSNLKVMGLMDLMMNMFRQK